MENIGETKIKGLYLGGRDLLADPVDETARAAAAEAKGVAEGVRVDLTPGIQYAGQTAEAANTTATQNKALLDILEPRVTELEQNYEPLGNRIYNAEQKAESARQAAEDRYTGIAQSLGAYAEATEALIPRVDALESGSTALGKRVSDVEKMADVVKRANEKYCEISGEGDLVWLAESYVNFRNRINSPGTWLYDNDTEWPGDKRRFSGSPGWPADVLWDVDVYRVPESNSLEFPFMMEQQLCRRDVLMPWEVQTYNGFNIRPAWPAWGEGVKESYIWDELPSAVGGCCLKIDRSEDGSASGLSFDTEWEDWKNTFWDFAQREDGGVAYLKNHHDIFLCLKGKSGGLNGNKGFMPVAQGQTFESDPGAPLLQFVKAHRSDSVVDPGLDKHWAGLFFIKGKMADGSEKYWCATRKRSSDGSGWEFGFDVADEVCWTREVTSCWAVW